jgi:predicted nucleic acid-binding Zn ribbon protein
MILRETELFMAELQKALDAANISIRDGGYYRGDVRVDVEAKKIIADVISGDESS